MVHLLKRVALATMVPLAVGAQHDSTRTFQQLSAPGVFDGISCAPTGKAKAGFYRSGRLESCPLAADTTLAGHRFAAETWVYLREDGSLFRAWLIRDTELQGSRCKGTGYKGWSVEFHPAGQLMMCYLAAEQAVNGVPCRAGSFWAEVTGGVKVYFHANGRLRSCVLAREFATGGVTFSRHDRIDLDSAGLLVPRRKQ